VRHIKRFKTNMKMIFFYVESFLLGNQRNEKRFDNFKKRL
jgi:hypothetical protein